MTGIDPTRITPEPTISQGATVNGGPELSITLSRNNAVVPEYATDGSAAFDLSAAAFLDPHDDYRATAGNLRYIYPGDVCWIGTGIHAAIPTGFAVEILPRSGKGAKEGLVLANGTGLLDSDYRGEWIVVLFNRTQQYPRAPEGFNGSKVCLGDRIAQARLVVAPQAQIHVVSELPSTARGAGGFGSSGG